MGGTSVKLDSAATVVYNSIPAACILFPLIMLVAHPIGWSGQDGTRTDFWVASQVWTHSKSTFALAASSSLASLIYNMVTGGAGGHGGGGASKEKEALATSREPEEEEDESDEEESSEAGGCC